MKRISFYLRVSAATLLMTLTAGCTSDSEALEFGSDNQLSFFLYGTRAGDTKFDTGDAVGIFASTAPDGSLSAGSNYADNVKYVYSGNRFINAGKGIEVPKDSENDACYYAVYPFMESTKTAFEFYVNEDQSTYDGFTKSDLCMAKASAKPTEALVPLKFNHMLSRVLIDASGIGLYPGRYRLELMAYQNGVKADVGQQSVTAISGPTVPHIKVCEDGANHFKAILPPQTLYASNVVGLLYIDNDLPISIILRDDIELNSGTSVELKLRKSGNDYYFDYGGTGNSTPDDEEAEPNPDVSDPNVDLPNIHVGYEDDGIDLYVRIDMTGVQDPVTKEWIRFFGTHDPNQNIWISVDDKPKAFTVYNLSDNDGNNSVKTDIVFAVDNSGSMSQEADAVARDILAWTQQLQSSGLDVRFACVGYSVSGNINGAIDFTDASALSTYLNRYSGTSRTVGFSGANGPRLQTAAASSFYRVTDECGAMAVRYADANLSFRSGANRIYVNFTDEPNQPNGKRDFSVEWFGSQAQWSSSQGTIHTVYSSTGSISERPYYNEAPWKMSEYTGGTIFKTSSSFTGVTLSELPITGALQHSYIIRFHNVGELLDGKTHVIKITLLSRDRTQRAVRTYNVVFTQP